MFSDEGGRAVPPSVPPLATVVYLCPACGWVVCLAVTEHDLNINRGAHLWVPCRHCGGYAFLGGVQPGGGVFDNYAVPEDAAAFGALGIKWEDA